MPPGSGVALLPRVFVRPRFNIRPTVDFARRIGKYCLRYCRITLRYRRQRLRKARRSGATQGKETIRHCWGLAGGGAANRLHQENRIHRKLALMRPPERSRPAAEELTPPTSALLL